MTPNEPQGTIALILMGVIVIILSIVALCEFLLGEKPGDKPASGKKTLPPSPESLPQRIRRTEMVNDDTHLAEIIPVRRHEFEQT